MHKFNTETQEEKYLPAYLLNATTALFVLTAPALGTKRLFHKKDSELGGRVSPKSADLHEACKTSMKKTEELLWEKVLL